MHNRRDRASILCDYLRRHIRSYCAESDGWHDTCELKTIPSKRMAYLASWDSPFTISRLSSYGSRVTSL